MHRDERCRVHAATMRVWLRVKGRTPAGPLLFRKRGKVGSNGAGPPERVKAGQGLTGSARAPGAVPDGVRDSFTPSVAATKFPAGLWQCRHCTPAARLGPGTAVWCRQSSLEGADG